MESVEKLVLDISPEVGKQLKEYAQRKGVTMNQLGKSIITQWLTKQKSPIEMFGHRVLE